MKKSVRLLAALVSAGLLLSAAALSVCADDTDPAAGVPVVEESFDDYDDNFDAKSTALFPTFMIDANSIGEGYVKVLENPDTGNLHLKSHVFTQVYTAEPVKGAYTFSMDVFQTQGNRECAIFLRAPLCGENAFYEADGSEDGQAACRTGVVINSHHTSIGVNIKSFSAKAADTKYLVQNIFSFDLPDGVVLGQNEYTNFKVEDTGTEMSIFVADTFICRIVFSEPDGAYRRAEVTEKCFHKAVLYDAAGTEMATIENPLVQSEGSTLGWATRVADMIVDNVYLGPLSETNTDETLPETEAASDTTAETAPAVETEPASADESTADTTADTTADSTADTVAETPAATEAPADDTGCASALTVGGLTALLGAAYVALKKKH